MVKKLSTFVLAAVIACSLLGCQGKSSSGNVSLSEDRESVAVDSSAGKPSESVDAVKDDLTKELSERETQDLYNAYIAINNHMVGPLNEALGQYFSDVDVQSEEFKLLEEQRNHYYCYYKSTCAMDMEKAYEIVNKKKEKDSLDQAFLDLYPSLKSLMPTLLEISDYTRDKVYLEDNYAKSQEQHTALISVLGDYLDAGSAFLDELAAVAEHREREALEEIKEAGYEVQYALNMVMLTARELRDELYAEEVWDENVLDMDLAKVQPLYDEFSSYVSAVLDYDQDKEKLKEEGFYVSVDGMRYWGFFMTAMNNMNDSITEVLEKVKAGEELDSFKIKVSRPGDGTLSAFEEGLSETINAYNDLIKY